MRLLSTVGLCALVAACSSGGGGGGAAGAGGSGGSSASGGTSGSGGASGSGGLAGAGATAGAAGAGGAAGATAEPRIEVITDHGKMVFELDATRMPITTANFLSYVDEGFFDGTIVHRVIPDFVIQGGGFEPGLSQKSTKAPIVLETSPEILHDYGVLSMARTTDPNSATSQFFVVNAKAGAHSLDGKYAAFGHMLEGDAALDSISAEPTHSTLGFDDVPVTDVVVTSVKRL